MSFDDSKSFYVEYIVNPRKGLIKLKHPSPAGSNSIGDLFNISSLVRLTLLPSRAKKPLALCGTKIRLLCWQYIIESSRGIPFSGHIRRGTAFKKKG